MSLPTTSARKRRPRLKVVGGERRPPRHRVTFGKWPLTSVAEFWTEGDWERLESWELPDPKNVAWFPGVGYLTLTPNVPLEEANEVFEEYSEAIRQGRVTRGEEA